jgi:thiamine-monophosphate kinase
VAEGSALLEGGLASAMIDLSDGLSSDLHHICGSSGVGAEIDAAAIPIDDDLRQFTVSSEQRLDFALNGGEDFELLFTVPQEKIPALNSGQLFRIGIVTANIGIVELTTATGKAILPSTGYRHF